MGISLAVGRLTLDQVAEVRILHPQPHRNFLAPVLRLHRLPLIEYIGQGQEKPGDSSSSVTASSPL